MEKKDENVVMRLPVRITYAAIQEYLRKRLTGEVIQKKTAKGEVEQYAEILELSLGRSARDNFDLVLELRLRTLTSFFRDKHVEVNLDIALQFDPTSQEIFVEDYSLDGENKSWLMNKFLQLMANNVFYGNLKKKMRADLGALIGSQVGQLNQKLEHQLEVFPGIKMSGDLRQFELVELLPEEESLLVTVQLSGNAGIDVEKIPL